MGGRPQGVKINPFIVALGGGGLRRGRERGLRVKVVLGFAA